MTLAFRTARSGDLDAILEVYGVAYPDDRSAVVRRRQLTTHPFGGLGRLVLAEERGTLAAFGFVFDLRVSFGGRFVRTGGIASVAVAAHARGRGVGRALVAHLGERAGAEKAAVTMLYPFRQGYYAALGYAPTSARKRLAIAPESIPRSFRTEPGVVVGPCAGADAAGIRRAYGRRARRESGLLERGEATWARRFLRERSHHLVARRGGKIVGYLAFEVHQDEPHASATLLVEELVADDASTRRALLGAVSALRDQVSELVIELPLGDPLEHVLLDADGRRHGTADVEHTIGTVVSGPMIRIVDVVKAIEARGYEANGTFGVSLEDEPGASFTVRVEAGRAVARRGGKTRATLTTTRRGLAHILYGALAPSSAVALGVARASAESQPLLDALLRIADVASLDPF